MKKTTFLSLATLTASLLFMGCAGDNVDTVTSVPTSNGISVGKVNGDKFATVWLQNIAGPISGLGTSAFPTGRQFWDIDQSFQVSDGNNDAFDGAVELRSIAVNGGAGAGFPFDQTYAEVSFNQPLFFQEHGLASAAVADNNFRAPLAGTKTAYLATGNLTQLIQPVNLNGQTGPIVLSFNCNIRANTNPIPGGPNATFRVVARDTNGNIAQTFLTNTTAGAGTNTVDISALAGQAFNLSFEAEGFSVRGFNTDNAFAVALDDVSITANGGPNLITNPGFENDLTGWINRAAPTSQFLRSAHRLVSGVDVERTVAALPTERFCRYFDTFTNPTASAINVTVTYRVDLGSDGNSLASFVPNTNNRAWTNVDQGGSDPDTGLVCGNLTYPAFAAGNDLIDGTTTFQLAPGQSKSVLQFLLMDNQHSVPPARAAALDTVAQQILANLGNNALLTAGLTAEEASRIVNF